MTNAYRLSGTVSGNLGAITFTNSANGDIATVSGDGQFTMGQSGEAGTAYALGFTQSSNGQSCTFSLN